MDVLWLGQPACHERARVGGKAATLSRLAARYRVPPGFCLTTATLEEGLAGRVVRGLTSSPPPLPARLYQTLTAAYQTLAERCGDPCPPVAVRSSAVEEDGGVASFAGQHETDLNVAGARAVAVAVGRCWASALAPRALAYRRRQGLPLEGGALAVLIQHLVQADVAAVVFSANPLTGDHGEAIVTASWGLGESIVGGTVTPDTYVVRSADLAVVSRQIATKERMTVPRHGGGTHEVDVPRFLRAQPVLSDQQAVEIAHLALSLEQTMGWPVDVECAYQGGTLYVLQCRPITTLPAR